MTYPTLTAIPWLDATVESTGHPAHSLYVETFWLPVLGPTATLLLRSLARALSRVPDGLALDLNRLSASLGVGPGSVPRAVGRCVRFGVARNIGPEQIAVRLVLPSLDEHQVGRLHPQLRELHAQARAALESG